MHRYEFTKSLITGVLMERVACERTAMAASQI